MNELLKDMLKKAKQAQMALMPYSQEQVDELVRAIAKVVYDNAEDLAKMAVDETRMGVYEDKVLKNKGKAKVIWNDLKDKKSVGIIDRNSENGIISLAKPVGVVGAVTPTTNPIVTPMSNAMFAIKGRNSIIVAPHPRAKACSAKTVDLCNAELAKLGAPENLIQIITEPSIDLTNELMQAVDVVIATGGMAMVRAAYSSGKPALGVGAGNVQVIIDRGFDFDQAAKHIIFGRKFDNGIICSGEQTVICHKDDKEAVLSAFHENGAFYSGEEETVEAFRKVIFTDGSISRDSVGQSVADIAKMAGVDVPADSTVILLEAKPDGQDVLRKEKMCPVLALFTYETFEEAVEIANTNLAIEGAGHTAAIHSNDQNHIDMVGLKLPVSRIVVNNPSSTTAGGSFFNGFAPTTTLGCGSWGNNSISENVTYKHLINIKRIGMPIAATVPTDDEIWG